MEANSDEITLAHNTVREFGYSIHNHCRESVHALTAIGAYEHAHSVAAASREFLDLLIGICGQDFFNPEQER